MNGGSERPRCPASGSRLAAVVGERMFDTHATQLAGLTYDKLAGVC
jgi:hypothetical protein